MAYLHCGGFSSGLELCIFFMLPGISECILSWWLWLINTMLYSSWHSFSSYLMWWKLLEVVNSLLIFQWGNKNNRPMRENLHSCSWSCILVPKEPSFPYTWGDNVWCLGRSSGGQAVPHKLQWRTVWRRNPSHGSQGLPAHLKDTPWHCGVPRYWSALWALCHTQPSGILHGTAVSQGTGVHWGLCVTHRPSPVQTRVCFTSVPHRKQNLASICACLHSPSSCSLIVFPKIPEQQSRWKPYLNLETVNTTCWAQWSNSSCFSLNDFFF